MTKDHFHLLRFLAINCFQWEIGESELYHPFVVFCALLGDHVYPSVTVAFEQLYYGYLVKPGPGMFWDTCPLTSQPVKFR